MHRSFASALSCLLLAAASAATAACPVPPAQMRAARIAAPGGPDQLRVETVPVPAIGADDVLARVHFASINPVDWKLQEAGRLSYPATPGGDFSGEVIALGANVRHLACGDRVAGVVDQATRSGSYAEYVAVPAADVVPVPARYSMAEAAAYPTVAIAAWRYMIAAAKLERGERVLVHGGAGGVGSIAVQMANARGAYVIATASARNHDYLRDIGADEVIDYRSTRFEDAVRDVDVVVDAVGGDTAQRSAAVLRDGGRLVSLAARLPAELCDGTRVVCPDTPPWDVAAGLRYAAPLIAAGQLRIHLDATYPLDAIATAQQHNRAGHTRGKVVVDMRVAAPAARAD